MYTAPIARRRRNHRTVGQHSVHHRLNVRRQHCRRAHNAGNMTSTRRRTQQNYTNTPWSLWFMDAASSDCVWLYISAATAAATVTARLHCREMTVIVGKEAGRLGGEERGGRGRREGVINQPRRSGAIRSSLGSAALLHWRCYSNAGRPGAFVVAVVTNPSRRGGRVSIEVR